MAKERLEQDRLTKFEELLERSGINPSDVGEIKKVNLWQAAKRDDENNWETIDLVGGEFTVANNGTEVLQPVEPAKIRVTKRNMARTAFKRILVYGDGQVDYRRVIDPQTDEMKLIPLHNEAAHNIIKQINADHQPEYTVNLGDFADMAALSRFSPDSDHFHKTLGPSMRYIHDFYAQMVTDNPKAQHVEVDSNHAKRIKSRVLENLPALHDFVRPGEEHPYPMMTYYYLANLGKLGIKFVSGYGSAEYVYGEEYGNPIVFKHGTHSSGAPGTTVRKEAAANPTVNVVRGHGHKDEQIYRTTREGRQLFYKQLGSTCLNTGEVPGRFSSIDDHNQPVRSQAGHQTTIAMIDDYMNGRYTLNTIDIQDGKAYFEGREYDGNNHSSQRVSSVAS